MAEIERSEVVRLFMDSEWKNWRNNTVEHWFITNRTKQYLSDEDFMFLILSLASYTKSILSGLVA